MNWQFGYFRRSQRWAPGGAADIKPVVNSSLWGAIWRLPDWSGMDRAEGVDRGAYKRIPVLVAGQQGALAVQTYTAVNKVDEICPRVDYWQRLILGAEQVGLPSEYCAFLRRHYRQLRGK